MNEYEIIGKIGEGTYGLVYLAKHKDKAKGSGKTAIKKFKQGKEGEGVSPTAIREIMLLRECSHENIVKLVNVHTNLLDMSLYLAFDYAEHDFYVSTSASLPSRHLRALPWVKSRCPCPVFFSVR